MENNGAWSMSRLAPDDADYVGWLCLIQKRDRDPGLLARGVSFWVSAVIVFFGFWSFIAVAALIAHAL